MDTSKEYIKMCEKAVKLQINVPPFHMQRTNNEIVYEDDDVWFHFWNGDEIKKTQLFRQDQLQEMISSELRELEMLWWDDYTAIKSGFEFTSMEQLWLAFVMKEKYQKQWVKGEWVNV